MIAAVCCVCSAWYPQICRFSKKTTAKTVYNSDLFDVTNLLKQLHLKVNVFCFQLSLGKIMAAEHMEGPGKFSLRLRT